MYENVLYMDTTIIIISKKLLLNLRYGKFITSKKEYNGGRYEIY